MASYAPLPAYQISNALINFKPLTDAIDANREDAARKRKLDMEDRRVGMDEERLGMTRQEFARAQEERQQQLNALTALKNDPETLRRFGPNAGTIINALTPGQAAGFLAKHPEYELERSRTAASIASSNASTALHQAQIGQMKYQTPEGRAAIAQANGLQPGSPGFQQFVLTGQMKEEDPIKGIIREFSSDLKPQQPAGPPAAMSPSPSQPGPRLIPQSFEGGPQGDPNLINVQQPGAQPQPQVTPQKTVQTPLGPMPEDKAKRMGFALALAGKGDAGKMMADSNPNALGKEGANLVDKNTVGQFDAIGRLEAMAAEYDPNLQTKQARAGQWLNQQLAGWGALSPQKQGELTQFVQQRAAAINNFNLRLKEASGTAVSAQEFERNQAELPNPGTGIINGIFDGDDPVTYAAKMKKGISLLKMGMARNLYLKNEGFRPEVHNNPNEAAKIVPVEQMPAIINKRASQIESELLKAHPNADRKAVDQAVKERVKREFGI